MLQLHGAVRGDCPAGIVRDFPYVSVRVREGPSQAAPVGNGGWADYRTPGALSFQQYRADLLGRSNVVSKLDPWCTVASEGSPQTENLPPA